MTDYASIRTRLRSRLDEISGRLQKISDEAHHDGEALNPDFAEQAVERENDEVLDALDGSIRAEIVQIMEALKRLDEGDYGVCTGCGEKISRKRLEALPFAPLCISCAEARTGS